MGWRGLSPTNWEPCLLQFHMLSPYLRPGFLKRRINTARVSGASSAGSQPGRDALWPTGSLSPSCFSLRWPIVLPRAKPNPSQLKPHRTAVGGWGGEDRFCALVVSSDSEMSQLGGKGSVLSLTQHCPRRKSCLPECVSADLLQGHLGRGL